MKLFQSALKKFQNVGIRPNQSRLNGKVLMAFTCNWLGTIFDCIFIAREVHSFSELVNSIFLTSATTTIAMCFTILIVNANKIFKLINNAERLADKGNIYVHSINRLRNFLSKQLKTI